MYVYIPAQQLKIPNNMVTEKKNLPEVRVSGILCKFPTDVSEVLSLILLWKNINRKWFD